MTPTPEQNAKRETPRTDAAIVQAGECYKTAEVVHADICRTLETELAELRQAADGMRDFADRLETRLESKLSCPDDCQCASRMLLNEYRAYRALAGEGWKEKDL